MMNDLQTNNPVNIFWTGGWDSTFRILQLLIERKKVIQPYYILDQKRKSAEAELNAMQAIRNAVFERYPYTKDLLRELIVENLEDIAKDRMLYNSFVDMTKKFSVGWQYSWLASYCVEKHISDMEMATQKPGDVYEQIVKDARLITEGNDSYYILETSKDQAGLTALFHYFRMPLLDYTKLEMQQEAEQHGFNDILELSWFCHAPKLNHKPCGTCTPCIVVMEQGMRRRMSFIGGLRYYLIVRTGLKKLREKFFNN